MKKPLKFNAYLTTNSAVEELFPDLTKLLELCPLTTLWDTVSMPHVVKSKQILKLYSEHRYLCLCVWFLML